MKRISIIFVLVAAFVASAFVPAMGQGNGAGTVTNGTAAAGVTQAAKTNNTAAQGGVTVPQSGTPSTVKDKATALHNGIFSNCSFGYYAMYSDGEVIGGLNEHHRLGPASNMKAITTALALEKLGLDYKWATTLSYSGTITADGVLEGDLYIIGGGDPTLGADHKPVSGQQAAQDIFTRWKTMLQSAGITRISGGIYGDGSWMDGQREEPSWLYEDLGTYYGVQVSGLNFFENRQNFTVKAGAAEGDSLNITTLYPDAPWMQWDWQCLTGAPKTGDKLYMYQNYGTTTGTLTGTFGADSKPKTLMCRNNYPERTLAHEFKLFLEEAGIEVEGEAGAADILDRYACEQVTALRDSLTVIGLTHSRSLKEVLDKTNKESDNFYAEMLMRTMGKEARGTARIAESRSAMTDVFKKIYPGYPTRELDIRDGSGLSCQNQVSPFVLCNFLQRMTARPTYDVFRGSLVKNGSRVWLKTGSMRGCRTLCGYILPSTPYGRTIVFSIMVNHCDMGIYSIEKHERTIIDELSRLN